MTTKETLRMFRIIQWLAAILGIATLAAAFWIGMRTGQQASRQPAPLPQTTAADIFRGDRNNRTLVAVRIDKEQPRLFMVDTGAPESYLFHKFYPYNGGVTREVDFPYAGGKVVGGRVNIGTLSFAGKSFSGVKMTVVSLPGIESEGIAGIIGDDLLRNHEVTFDYEAFVMKLRQ